eukprot:3267091-Amphidinium_carterae.1
MKWKVKSSLDKDLDGSYRSELQARRQAQERAREEVRIGAYVNPPVPSKSLSTTAKRQPSTSTAHCSWTRCD